MAAGWLSVIHVYRPRSQEDGELCHPLDEGDLETINLLVNGEPRAQTWRPIRVQVHQSDEGRALRRVDAPWLGAHALIFRRPALGDLEGLLLRAGELLPLDCRGEELVVFNPRLVPDALDEGKSDVVRFKGSETIMRIARYAFRSDLLHEVVAFKIPNLRVSPTFVTDVLVEAWRAAGLKGLELQEVWPQPAKRRI